jgi:alginate O-acetyltransferase complex protein AlgI
MLFNSLAFVIFLPIVFILYWSVPGKNIRIRNLLLVIASYVFYGWWDWRFLSLIFISSLVDFFLGYQIERNASIIKRKILLISSIVVNLGILGFFKYFNFFIDNLLVLFNSFGYHPSAISLRIILPVGISFYTFQTMSYTIDVYRKKIKATKDILAFFAFVSFFPQLVAGPIERASSLLPQFKEEKKFDYSKTADGLRQSLWGFFKKLVIADNCGNYVGHIFEHYNDLSGISLFLGAVLFGIQIYCDFSGYSDIAIGTARLFGFNLMRNFNYPYFSRDIAEFWRRWHISLTTWFRDYLYIPLGGSRGSGLSKFKNTLIVFTVSGFWHGANWTFIAWGVLNAIFFLPLMLSNKNRQNLDTPAKNSYLPGLKEGVRILGTFCMVSFSWIFFRSENLSMAFSYIGRLFGKLLLNPVKDLKIIDWPVIICLLIMLFSEWIHRRKQHALEFPSLNWKIRWFIYLLIGLAIFCYGCFDKTEFIYFAF